MRRRHLAAERGFTLIELLTVVAVIALIAIVAVPNLMNARGTAGRKQAMTNIMGIALLLDKVYTKTFAYSDGQGRCEQTQEYCNKGCGGQCTGGNSLDPDRDGAADLVILGDGYKYIVTATDGPDPDKLCENYTIVAESCAGEANAQIAEVVLTLSSTGAKTGPW